MNRRESQGRRICSVLIWFLAGLLLVGCATVETRAPEESKIAETRPVPPGKALIYIYRDYSDALVKYEVIVDNQSVSELASNTFLVIETASGQHAVRSRMGGRMLGLNIQAEQGKRNFVALEFAMTGFYIFFSTYEYRLRRVSEEVGQAAIKGKSLVKHIDFADPRSKTTE